MKGVNLAKAREILDACGGEKVPIGEMTRRFVGGEAFSTDFLDDLANEVTRKVIHQLNKEARSLGRFEEQHFNFVARDEDGNKEQYYRPLNCATAEECAQLTKTEYRKWNAQGRKFFEILDYGKSSHGRQFTRLLPFDWKGLQRPCDAEAVGA